MDRTEFSLHYCSWKPTARYLITSRSLIKDYKRVQALYCFWKRSYILAHVFIYTRSLQLWSVFLFVCRVSHEEMYHTFVAHFSLTILHRTNSPSNTQDHTASQHVAYTHCIDIKPHYIMQIVGKQSFQAEGISCAFTVAWRLDETISELPQELGMNQYFD